MSEIEAVTAAGGVVFDSKHNVLLIFRRGVWDLPKGKLEDDETVEECAVREVAEEIGTSEEPNIIGQLQDTYHEYLQQGIHYGKTTHWYAMQLTSAPTEFKPESKEGIEEVRWIELEQAKALVGYDNLVKVLESFEQWHQTTL